MPYITLSQLSNRSSLFIIVWLDCEFVMFTIIYSTFYIFHIKIWRVCVCWSDELKDSHLNLVPVETYIPPQCIIVRLHKVESRQ